MKRLLGMILCLTGVLGGGTVQAAEDLPPVFVYADSVKPEAAPAEEKEEREAPRAEILSGSSVSAGVLGRKEEKELPFSVSSLPVGQSAEKAGNGFSDVLERNPEILSRGGNSMNEITIRGFAVSLHDAAIDGIPGLLNPSSLDLHGIASVEVLSVPASLLSGSSSFGRSPVGAVNLVPLKAESTPVRTVTTTFSGRGNRTAAFDWGERFGEEQEWGLRVNGDISDGETARKGEDFERQHVFLDADYEKGGNKGNFFLSYNHTKDSAPDLALRLGQFGLPGGFSGRNSLTSSDTAQHYTDTAAGLSFEHAFTDDFSAFFKAGMLDDEWTDGMIQPSPTLAGEQGNYMYMVQRLPIHYRRYSLLGGLRGNFRTGALRHEAVLSWDYQKLSWQNHTVTPYTEVYTGNLYTGIIARNPDMEGEVNRNPVAMSLTDQDSEGVSLTDTVSWGKWKFLLSWRHQEDSSSDGYKGSGDAPGFGISYDLTENLTAYADWVQGILGGSTVAPGHPNTGEYLEPVKTVSREAGLKWEKNGLRGSVSYFSVSEEIPLEDALTGRLDYDGHQKSEGVTVKISGRPGDRWEIAGGLSLLRTENCGGDADGKDVYGVPGTVFSLSADYRAGEKLTVGTRVLWHGSSWADEANTKRLPPFARFDLLASWKFSEDTVLSAEIDNLFDRKYWYSGGNNAVYRSYPRTAVISLSRKF